MGGEIAPYYVLSGVGALSRVGGKLGNNPIVSRFSEIVKIVTASVSRCSDK